MLIDALQQQLNQAKQDHLLRQRQTIDRKQENIVWMNNKKLINFCSNDYLGLATHPKLKHAAKQGIDQYGVDATASFQVSGHHKPHQICEENMAAWLQRDKALLFNSGYHANLALMTTLLDPDTLVVADKQCHASLIDGILLSKAKLYRHRHADRAQLNVLLQKSGAKKLLLTESIFSMHGDITPMPDYVAAACKNAATLIVDDTHGLGVLGQHGAGICDHFQLPQNHVPAVIASFGKAFGSAGAIVAGDRNIIDSLAQFGKTYRYSTALPPAIALANTVALAIIQQESWRRLKLDAFIKLFVAEAKLRHIPLMSEAITPIKPILIGNNQAALKLQHFLSQQGFYVAAIRPPSVAVNTARLRISLNCMHTEAQIMHLLDVIAEYLC